jgi:hypothetical protein
VSELAKRLRIKANDIDRLRSASGFNRDRQFAADLRAAAKAAGDSARETPSAR